MWRVWVASIAVTVLILITASGLYLRYHDAGPHSADQLTSAVRKALSNNDSDALADLFVSPHDARLEVKGQVAQFVSVPSQELKVKMVIGEQETLLVAVNGSPRGPFACQDWAVVQRGQRWLLNDRVPLDAGMRSPGSYQGDLPLVCS